MSHKIGVADITELRARMHQQTATNQRYITDGCKVCFREKTGALLFATAATPGDAKAFAKLMNELRNRIPG